VKKVTEEEEKTSNEATNKEEKDEGWFELVLFCTKPVMFK
jgi:hypothetical protein